MISQAFLLLTYLSLCESIYKKLSNLSPSEENTTVCSLLIEDALEVDFSVVTTLAVAFEESRFTAQLKPTKSNCVGPLQIKVKYWCPDKRLDRCEPIYEGVKALKYYVKKFKPERKAVCFYNNSKKKECSEKYKYTSHYVKNVYKHKKKIRDILKKKEFKDLL